MQLALEVGLFYCLFRNTPGHNTKELSLEIVKQVVKSVAVYVGLSDCIAV